MSESAPTPAATGQSAPQQATHHSPPQATHNSKLFRGMRAGLIVFLGIWLGSLIMVSITATTVQNFFKQGHGLFPAARPDVAGEVNQLIFYRYSIVQLVCLIGVLICGVFTWLASERGRRRVWSISLACVLTLGYLGYVSVANQIQALWPEVRDELRLENPPNRKSAVREQFGQYHVIAIALMAGMLVNVTTLLVLLGTQRVLPPEPRRKPAEKGGDPPAEAKINANPLFT